MILGLPMALNPDMEGKSGTVHIGLNRSTLVRQPKRPYTRTRGLALSGPVALLSWSLMFNVKQAGRSKRC